jgi:hypothetical protein
MFQFGSPMPVQVPKTRWGGIADGRFRPTGFFRVDQCDGVFWLVDPDGGRFLSKGVNSVRFDQDAIQNSNRIPYAEACRKIYGGESAWRMAAARRLASWRFNTLGSWSDEAVATAAPLPLAVTPNLDLGMSFARPKNERPQSEQEQVFPDVFDPKFDSHIHREARESCEKRRDDPGIIGWFIDNELCWGPDWRGPDELLTLFLNRPAASPGRAAAITWLREHHHDFERFNFSWRTPAQSWDELIETRRIAPPYRRQPSYERSARNKDEDNLADPGRGAFAVDCDAFLALLAERYFDMTSAAIKAADPHHLVLGCRFAFPPPAAVIDATARHVDVISFNCYGLDADGAIDAYAVTGKPCLIGEFSFRAADSGLPNTIGAGPQVATQTERAAAFRHYVTAALQKRTLVGYHWFEHADEPAEGRTDGENSNYGIVTINDRVYEELPRTMTSVNAEAEDLHAAAAGAAT